MSKKVLGVFLIVLVCGVAEAQQAGPESGHATFRCRACGQAGPGNVQRELPGNTGRHLSFDV